MEEGILHLWIVLRTRIHCFEGCCGRGIFAWSFVRLVVDCRGPKSIHKARLSVGIRSKEVADPIHSMLLQRYDWTELPVSLRKV